MDFGSEFTELYAEAAADKLLDFANHCRRTEHEGKHPFVCEQCKNAYSQRSVTW
jgi:hypothetical protein